MYIVRVSEQAKSRVLASIVDSETYKKGESVSEVPDWMKQKNSSASLPYGKQRRERRNSSIHTNILMENFFLCYSFSFLRRSLIHKN